MNTINIIPLGGVGEVGRNMWVLEDKNEIVVLDCGVMFPDAEMYGVDLVLPDISYLRERTKHIKGILLSHGHEDHVGAIPHLIADLGFPPVYGTTLTLGLVRNKLKEHRLLDKVTLCEIAAGENFQVGSFAVEPFRIAHSIPDSVGFGITTSAGIVMYLTDWKFDHMPVGGKPTDVPKLAEFGQRGTLALITDCVRVEVPGYTPSEQTVGETFDTIFATAPGRIILATFASNIGRVQQVIDSAEAYGRKVVAVGRSMENNSRVAFELGFLHAEPGTMIRASEMGSYPDEQLAIICTGSQGEPLAALSRMSNNDHAHIKIKPGDTVVFSATPIPGNEVSVSRVINNLFRIGADVIYGSHAGVHVSGHAAQEELKMLLALVRPRYVIPFHGDYRHLVLYRKLVQSLGGIIPDEHVIVAEGGDIIAVNKDYAAVSDKAPAAYIYVDGATVGDVGNVVVRDRQMLARDGILMVVVGIDRASGDLVSGPDIVSRGFVHMRESGDLMDTAKTAVRRALTENHTPAEADVAFINRRVKDTVNELLYRETRRRPIIIPVVMEI